jgi:hypothetical protein
MVAAERLGKAVKKKDVTATDRTTAFLNHLDAVGSEFNPRKAGRRVDSFDDDYYQEYLLRWLGELCMRVLAARQSSFTSNLH